MSTDRVVKIDPSKFPDGWIRVPFRITPILRQPGAISRTSRLLTAFAFPRPVYSQILPWSKLSLDEKWVAAASVWSGILESLLSFPDCTESRPDLNFKKWRSLVKRMALCTPPGYEFTSPDVTLPFACHVAVCPFCYARRVSELVKDVNRVLTQAPPRKLLYAYLIANKGSRQNTINLLRRLKPTGAVGVFTPRSVDEDEWYSRIVGLTFDHKQVASDESTRLRHRYDVSDFLVRKLLYPRIWSSRNQVRYVAGALHTFCNHKNLRTIATYGMARQSSSEGG